MYCNYPNDDLVNRKAYLKFGENQLICSRDTEQNEILV